jgi:ribosomal-protein-alanine N-acetyltransferase
LNEAPFIRYIGDRGVRNIADAQRYLEQGPLASYAQYGFGLYLTESIADRRPLGMCGLLQRDYLDAPDLGFAFLMEHWSRGFAYEAAVATLSHGREALGIRRVLAVTSLDNQASMQLLAKLGFTARGTLQRGQEQLNLFEWTS